ncbi:hypothetical protein D1872_199760 [compost metagenome]
MFSLFRLFPKTLGALMIFILICISVASMPVLATTKVNQSNTTVQLRINIWHKKIELI